MKTKFNSAMRRRRSIRLKGYDYSQKGLYFVTICCKKMRRLFGRVEQGVMYLNDAGQMVHDEWKKLPERFPNVRLHEFEVMPNHFHGILEIVELGGEGLEAEAEGAMNEAIGGGLGGAMDEAIGGGLGGATARVARTWRLGDMVGAFKSIVAVGYGRGVREKGWEAFAGKLWHRNYFEKIIRDRWAYRRIARYIKDNPKNWDKDKYNKDKYNKDKEG